MINLIKLPLSCCLMVLHGIVLYDLVFYIVYFVCNCVVLFVARAVSRKTPLPLIYMSCRVIYLKGRQSPNVSQMFPFKEAFIKPHFICMAFIPRCQTKKVKSKCSKSKKYSNSGKKILKTWRNAVLGEAINTNARSRHKFEVKRGAASGTAFWLDLVPAFL